MTATDAKEYPKGLERTTPEELQAFIKERMAEDAYSVHPALADVWTKCTDLVLALRPLMPQSTACQANEVVARILENTKLCMIQEGEIEVNGES